MARKDRPKLRPIHELTPEEQFERRWARRNGFRDENQLRRLVHLFENLPYNDPRYLDPAFQGDNRYNEILRLKRIHKRTLSPAKEIRRKANLLVWDMNKMSALNFIERYMQQIKALFDDPKTNSYDKKILKDTLKRLTEKSRTYRIMGPGEQGELFG